MPQSRRLDKKGFTLMEILIAISIIAIVSVAIVTAAVAAQKAGRDAQRKSDLRKIQLALQQYYDDHGYYPDIIQLETDGQINNCTGRPAGCVVSKIYLNPIPEEYFYTIQFSKGFSYAVLGPPNYNGYNEIHYCYQSQVSSTNTTRCDTSATSGLITCNYYHLYARLENGPQPGALLCNAGGAHTAFSHRDNYTITPDTP